MNSESPIGSASSAVRRLWERHGIKEPLRFLGFCLSLLPIPVIHQAGLALDKHLTDKKFESEVEELWAAINHSNATVATIDTVEQAIPEIAKTVASDVDLNAKTQEFIRTLAGSETVFAVLTENNSYQKIVNSLIKADTAKFSAHAGSTNVLTNSRVEAKQTLLHATDRSQNLVSGTTFHGTGGVVSMDNMSAEGPISMQGSLVGMGDGGILGFGPGGMLGFGPSTENVSANCPGCGAFITAERSQLAGLTSIQCPRCKKVLAFRSPSAPI